MVLSNPHSYPASPTRHINGNSVDSTPASSTPTLDIALDCQSDGSAHPLPPPLWPHRLSASFSAMADQIAAALRMFAGIPDNERDYLIRGSGSRTYRTYGETHVHACLVVTIFSLCRRLVSRSSGTMIPPISPVQTLLAGNAKWAEAVDRAEPGFFQRSALGQYPKA